MNRLQDIIDTPLYTQNKPGHAFIREMAKALLEAKTTLNLALDRNDTLEAMMRDGIIEPFEDVIEKIEHLERGE